MRLHDRDGYQHTTAADIAQLTGLHQSTVSSHLADLARRHWIRRLPDGRPVGYRPETRAEEWIV